MNSFGCLVALNALCQIIASPVSLDRQFSNRISSRLLNRKSVCAAAMNTDINFSIFKQCIISFTEDDMPDVIGDFVALQPSIFSQEFKNESHFRKVVFDKLIDPWLMSAELAPGCCRCKENGRGEVLVSSVLDFCSIHKSWMDISFMFEDEGAVLGFIEGKIKEPSFLEIRQTVAYSVCALAYCRWGRWKNKEPLVSLILSPQSLYLLIFSKSSNSAFGIELKIEKTKNKVQMEYELKKYVTKYIEDFHKAETAIFIGHDSVNPLDWTPMNLKMEDLPPYTTDSERWRKPLMSKNGFLFRTSSDAVKNLQAKYGRSKKRSRSSIFPDLASGIPVFVKYLSALLDSGYGDIVLCLRTLLVYSEGERKRSAVEKRLLAKVATLAARNQKYKKRSLGLTDLLNQIKKPSLGLIKMATSIEDEELSNSEAEDQTLVDTEEVVQSPPTATTISYVEDIVHPYIGILFLANEHPMVVMHDAGDSLYDLVYCSDSKYRLEWQRYPEWRSAFLNQIGLSALNLVDKVTLCHNDIRLPNIAMRNGRFCLIDFDFSFASVVFQPNSAFSPPLSSCAGLDQYEMAMCYSVAQITVNVFLLSASTQFSMGEVTAAVSIWSEVRNETSPVDREFQAWVDEKGGLLPDFVSTVRAACKPGATGLVSWIPEDFKRYCVAVLQRMLVE